MRTASREVRANTAAKRKVITSIALISFSVVLDNERTSAANKKQSHHFAPVVGVEALFESGKTGERCVRVLQAEFGLADLFQHVLGTNPDVFLLIDEKAKLIREVQISLVVRSC